jgi:hypothetical protein
MTPADWGLALGNSASFTFLGRGRSWSAMKLAGSRNTAPGTAVPGDSRLDLGVQAGPSGGISAHSSQQPEAGRQRCEGPAATQPEQGSR